MTLISIIGLCAWIYLFVYDWKLAIALSIVMTVDNMFARLKLQSLEKKILNRNC